jgi:Na+-driven multidrug efflux pump
MIIGITINIILNFIFITKFGVYGAAYSTILALFFLEFIYDFFDPKLREIHTLKFKSIF